MTSKEQEPDVETGVVGRNPARTRQAIIDAATEEFATLGLGGARIDSIAARAGLNKRLLYYYFGNKDALFLAVLERAYENIRNAERALQLDELDPVEAIRQLVSFTWRYYIAHPEFLTLLNSENLHQAAHLKTSERIQEMNSPLIETLDRILEKGRASGLFRAGVDPLQLYISIAGLSFFYLSNRHTLSTVFGRDLRHPKAEAERLSHMTDLVLGYLLR
ncbi:MAG TPA: TetR/AcrR family transcriptional regulator [Noviherbaspirillum sp.]|nr:TetR/AcrR family transcriptional regulator [Noviherbaspirillum sp.]